MPRRSSATLALLALVVAAVPVLEAQSRETRFEPEEVFGLEYASDPRISPDGETVVYVRNFFDVMRDVRRSNLWLVSADGALHRPLTTGNERDFSPRWSPAGDRIVYVSGRGEGAAQMWVRWLDTGQEAKLTNLTETPSGLSWSPDGEHIAFTLFVPEKAEPFATLPSPPENAQWAERPTVIDDLRFRADGSDGFVRDGATHVFVLPSSGGTPRQLTFGERTHSGAPAWTPDGSHLIVSGNDDPDGTPQNTDLFAIRLDDASVRRITDRYGPENAPAVSPDGRWVAYTGYEDRHRGYQVASVSIVALDGSARAVAASPGRSVGGMAWNADGSGLYAQYDDRGNTKVAFLPLEGGSEPEVLTGDVGGTSLGRPYAGGSFTASPSGRIAFTHSRPDRPADVAIVEAGLEARTITQLNEDLFGHRQLGEVEEIWWESSYDGREIQGWIVKPPGFDPSRRYPFILEIHGGPFANYGDRFSSEIQLYAAQGYVVLYANPRGSSSYGEEFGNLIHHAYPSQDYDDLMSGVDAVIERGYVDESNLFVTGGSGGGVLTAWIVGKTDRFRAAVVAKPVINWASFVLTADATPFFSKYWFPSFPWEDPEHYWERSPLSLVGNVTTPTMLLTGEADYRTPMSESEQYYTALQLRGVPSALVRIPGASHGIANRPSQLMAKVVYILEWFERHRTERATVSDPQAGD